MSTFEAAGYLASSLVFAAFCMEGMVRLRAVALASNVAFIVYSIGFGLAPIFLLHAALLPVNTWRLWQAVRTADSIQTIQIEARATSGRNGQGLG